MVRSATGSTAASRDTCARAKDAIFCAPTRPKKTRPSCGASCTVGDDRGGLQDPQKPAPGKAGSDLAIRPIFRQLEARIEAHVFIAFLPYCLHVTLGRRLHALAPGLTPRSVLEKFAAVRMIDVHLPTTEADAEWPSQRRSQ